MDNSVLVDDEKTDIYSTPPMEIEELQLQIDAVTSDMELYFFDGLIEQLQRAQVILESQMYRDLDLEATLQLGQRQLTRYRNYNY